MYARWIRFGVILTAAGLTIGWFLWGQRWVASQPPRPRADQPHFVGEQRCIDCHQAEYDGWLQSHHRMSMMLPGEDTVRGDFNDAQFTHFGVTSRFYRQGKDYYVHTVGADGQMHDYRVAYTFGITPLQQYLIAFPDGRLQALSIAWDDEQKQWYHLYGDEHIPHTDELFWTGRHQNWNYMCASCHSTNLQKNYDLATNTFATTYDIINVSCEACHGPGSRHVQWAEAPEDQQPLFPGNRGLVTQLKHDDPHYELNACAPCHARREVVSDNFVHGEPFYDHFLPELLVEPLYHADGQILDEVFEYASFTQSRMYREHVRCSDCHDSHSLQLKHTGNALCTQCHDAGRYDTDWHHVHVPGEEGSACVDCHMTGRTYMGIDFRRDHNFRVPRPDLTVLLGETAAPNACNECHQDESPQWAADTVADWYNHTEPLPWHYAQAFAAARSQSPHAVDGLLRIVADAELSHTVRATAVQYLGEHDDLRARRAVRELLRDEHPLVRATAAAAMEPWPAEARLAALAPLLSDEMRAVRVRAARVLSSVPLSLFDADQRAAFDAALDEYVRSQLELADQPGARLNLAVLSTHLNQPDKAEQWYRSAIALDTQFLPAYLNLAMLYNHLGRRAEAEQMLQKAVAQRDDFAEAHYSLGLLLGEQAGRLDEATTHLHRAAQLLPDRPRVHYNHALALQHSGRHDDAWNALQKALHLAPDDPDLLHAAVIFLMQQQQWQQARHYAQRLYLNEPARNAASQMLRHIDARLRSAEPER